MTFLAGILSIVLSMLFIIVAGRLTGTIGTSNLPVSGMTIASLVILTLVFLTMGWTSSADLKSLLLFGTFIVVAISVAGGYTQAQKLLSSLVVTNMKYVVSSLLLPFLVL